MADKNVETMHSKDGKALREAVAVIKEIGVKSIGHEQMETLAKAHGIIDRDIRRGDRMSVSEQETMQTANAYLKQALEAQGPDKQLIRLKEIMSDLGKYADGIDRAYNTVRGGNVDAKSQKGMKF